MAWAIDLENDWHKWWYKFVNDRLDIIQVTELSYLTFCRLWATEKNTFHEMLDIQHDWRDLRLLYESEMWGRDNILKVWPQEIVETAELRWNTGYFNKYINSKAVIFDLDGVLVSTDILHKNALVEAAFSVINKTVHVSEKCMLSTREKVKKLQIEYNFSDSEYANIIHRKDEIFSRMVSELTVGNNVIETLSYLKKLNIKTAIASNSRKINVDMVLKSTGLEKYFDIIISAEEVANRKPAPDILFEAYKRLGISGSDTVFVEDSEEGIQAGVQSLSRVIKVNNPSELSIDLFRNWLE